MNINNLKSLADSFVETDSYASRADVDRLGLAGAADYQADMAAGQPDWEALDTDAGRRALRAALKDLTA
jgi:hypothetical protein